MLYQRDDLPSEDGHCSLPYPFLPDNLPEEMECANIFQSVEDKEYVSSIYQSLWRMH